MAQEQPKYRRRPFPAHTLRDALALAQAIQDSGNGHPMNRVLLADAINRRPASSDYRDLLSSGLKYGLTIGNEKSDMISLTPVAISITKPTDAEERARALREAAFQPEIFRRIYEKYSNGKLPQSDFFLTVLEREFKIPRDRCAECAEIVTDNGRFVGIVRELKDTLYVILEGEPAAPSAEAAALESGQLVAEAEEEDHSTLPPPPPPSASEHEIASERFIFIAHGKNKKPLDQLEQVLKQFGIPYKVAIYEPQIARPISEKVAQTMRECHSAILIFTADEQFKTSNDDVIWRPSQNVIYELGAASILYQNRVVIFKEEKLDFPTDFRDIGHISFETDRLDAKGVDLIKELIALGLVKVQAA